jgi:hypothetical protein
MGQIIDDVLNMTDEEFLSLRKKIKEIDEIKNNATIEEKRAIYNDKKKFKDFISITSIFQELNCLFSWEIDEIEEIGENEDYEKA